MTNKKDRGIYEDNERHELQPLLTFVYCLVLTLLGIVGGYLAADIISILLRG